MLRTLTVSVLFLSYNVIRLVTAMVLSYEEARCSVLEQTTALRKSRTLRTERVPLLDALDRTLAEPVRADRDQPPFPRSTRDGYACRASDLAEQEALCIVGSLRAGNAWTGPALAHGEAIEIMTGAPVPTGADCVLMVEHVTLENDRIIPQRRLEAGENVVPAGAEARSGATLLSAGTYVGPQQIALAAACGYESVSVYAQPRVAILATGDELVPVGRQPLPHQIRNSNSYSLAAQVKRHGGAPVLLPTVKDNLEASERAIRSAFDCDLLLLSGGVSMGKYDFVEQALENLGANFFFTGARIQPGRPVVFGQLPDQNLYFFGLPGNPISTMVTFALFAEPLLRTLAGQNAIGPEFAQARLLDTIESKPGLTRFLPAHTACKAEGAVVVPLAWHGSGDQSAAAKANCFIVVPDGAALEAGATVTFLKL